MDTGNDLGSTEQYMTALSELLATCATAARDHQWRQVYEAIRTGSFALILRQCEYAAHTREDGAELFDGIHTKLVMLREQVLHSGLDMDVMLQHRGMRPTLPPW